MQRGIEQVDLTVKQGEAFGFIGPNGAGKSITLRTMMQLIRPTAGTVELFGEQVSKERPDLRRRIGYLPSEVHYHPDMTGMEVLAFAASVHGLALKYTPALAYAERLKLDVRKPSSLIRSATARSLASSNACSTNRILSFWMNRRPVWTRSCSIRSSTC
ncbi:ATP-binding cassette domain-containing protein [Paenibacillus sp. MER TA 81-3]|nr:ATP-binding cassette domain-containing protein [Paenibacillus sp. MER TA 81-3]